jgi:type I restriction enzyme S subunit
MSLASVPLGEIAEINPLHGEVVDPETEVSFLRMADVSELGTTTLGKIRSYGEVRTGYTPFRTGDVLIAKITPCFQNGKIAQAQLEREIGAGSTEFHVVRAGKDVDAGYLLRFLRQDWIRIEGELRMTGSGGQRRVPEAYLRNLMIPLPSIAKQKRIATVLDQVDTLRAKRREAMALLGYLAQSVFLDMFGDPARNPLGWPVGKVGDLLSSANYGSSAKADMEGDIPVLRMNNITASGDVDMRDLKYLPKEQVSEKHLVRAGDVLFNRTNSAELVGKTAIYRLAEEVAYAGYLVRLRVSEENHPEYLAAFLNSRYAKRVLRSMSKSIVGMANINAKEVQSMKILIPPLTEQKRFAAAITQVEAAKEPHRAHLATLDELFTSLQHRAFSGTL